ncbi:MAG: NTP transferase domain-containing protein, partial [Bacteroidota bacterium]
MLKECIILAGGLGTRLRSVVADQPKVLAPVNDQPFLKYIIDKLLAQDFNHVVLSTGYLHEKIEEFISVQYPGINISIAV